MTFEDAVRAYFGVPGDWLVQSEVVFLPAYQLGEYTWDTEPRSIVLHARPPRTIHRRSGTFVMADTSRSAEWKTARFDNLPELWAALSVG